MLLRCVKIMNKQESELIALMILMDEKGMLRSSFFCPQRLFYMKNRRKAISLCGGIFCEIG